jgi:hypothetical protein
MFHRRISIRVELYRRRLQAPDFIGDSDPGDPQFIAADLILANMNVRIWTAADVERAKKFKGSLKRGPKPKK